MQILCDITVVLCDLEGQGLVSHNADIHRFFYQNQFINKWARKNLAKRVLCDLPCLSEVY